MPGYVKVILFGVGYLVFCYAFGISATAIPAGIWHGLQVMHAQSVSGGH